MDVQNQIQNFIEKELLNNDSTTHLDEKINLIDNDIIDSLAIMKIIVFIEDQFKLKIDDSLLLPDHFETIGNIAKMIEDNVTA